MLFLLASSGAAHAAARPILTVGTEGVYAPFTFTDEKGQLTGYDVEVVREVAARAGFDVRFVPTPWDGIFLGLEAKKFDLVANEIAETPERARKYLFTTSYLVSGAQIIVRADRGGTFDGLGSLAGLRVGEGVGSNYGKLLEDYNATHDRKIDLRYYEGNFGSVLQDLAAGRLDATVNDRLTAGYDAGKLGVRVKLVGKPLALVPSHLVARRDPDGEALVRRLDGALAALRKDGTLSRISVKWFGADYTR